MSNQPPDGLHSFTKQVNVKEELKELTTTRIRTSFIYPISQLEEIFGDLWGEKKDENAEFTPQEQEWYNKFSEWRKRVLDFGNNQIRLSNAQINKRI